MSKYKPIKIEKKDLKIKNPYHKELKERQFSGGGGLHESKKYKIEEAIRDNDKEAQAKIIETTESELLESDLMNLFAEINGWWDQGDNTEESKQVQNILTLKIDLKKKAEMIKNLLTKELDTSQNEMISNMIKKWIGSIDEYIKQL